MSPEGIYITVLVFLGVVLAILKFSNDPKLKDAANWIGLVLAFGAALYFGFIKSYK